MRQIRHEIEPVEGAGLLSELVVARAPTPATGSREMSPLRLANRVELAAELVEEQRVVLLIRRRGRIFPIEIDTTEERADFGMGRLDEELDAGQDESLPRIAGSRHGAPDRRVARMVRAPMRMVPAADTHDGIERRPPGLECDELGEVVFLARVRTKTRMKNRALRNVRNQQVTDWSSR